MIEASIEAERTLVSSGTVIGIDEVGRGALAGPVLVGAVAVDVETTPILPGLRDSKLLSPKRRAALVPDIERWCQGFALGEASNCEVDEFGIVAALQLAAHRALVALNRSATLVILDGTSNWLGEHLPAHTLIHTEARADQRFASVAAASVLAKVARDTMMTDLHPNAPDYAWVKNKGYGSVHHMEALRRLGPSDWHRRSWNLPSTA